MFGRKKKLEPIVVKEYRNSKEYEKDARLWVAKGYRIANVVTEQAKPATLLLGGIGLLANTRLIVTYQLEA